MTSSYPTSRKRVTLLLYYFLYLLCLGCFLRIAHAQDTPSEQERQERIISYFENGLAQFFADHDIGSYAEIIMQGPITAHLQSEEDSLYWQVTIPIERVVFGDHALAFSPLSIALHVEGQYWHINYELPQTIAFYEQLFSATTGQENWVLSRLHLNLSHHAASGVWDHANQMWQYFSYQAEGIVYTDGVVEEPLTRSYDVDPIHYETAEKNLSSLDSALIIENIVGHWYDATRQLCFRVSFLPPLCIVTERWMWQ